MNVYEYHYSAGRDVGNSIWSLKKNFKWHLYLKTLTLLNV